MKKFIIFFVIIHSCFSTIAQQKSFNYPVLLFPMVDHTTIKVNGENKKLDAIRACSIDEKIEVIKGKLSLLDAYGNEITFDSGKKFSINGKSKKDSKQLYSSMDKLSKFIDNPSVYLPNLYSSERNDYVIFPIKSKVCNKSNIQFQLSQYILPNAKFVLYDNETNSTIWQTTHFANGLNFRKAPLELGKAYTWKLYNGSNSLKGEIELLPEKQIKEIFQKDLETKQDYLHAFIIYLENECRFDAITTLDEAIRLYPESILFKRLQYLMPSKSSDE